MPPINGLSRDRHAVILDSVNDGVFTVDDQWRITSFNRAAERITGVKRQQAIGKRCCEVFRASICETACALRQTLKTGRPVVNKAVYILDARAIDFPSASQRPSLRMRTARRSAASRRSVISA